MVKQTYIPERGDIVWVDLNPTSGHEQAGKRPALVISPKLHNQATGLAFLCPITSKIKGYPFEAAITCLKTPGSVLINQMRSIDWKACNVEFLEKAPEKSMSEVFGKLKLLCQP